MIMQKINISLWTLSDLETLDAFVDALIEIKHEAETQPELLKNAPHTLPVKRLDDVKAAKDLNIIWKG